MRELRRTAGVQQRGDVRTAVQKRPPRRSRPPRATAEAKLSDLMAGGEGAPWLLLTATCRRCGARFTHCPQSGVSDGDAQLCGAPTDEDRARLSAAHDRYTQAAAKAAKARAGGRAARAQEQREAEARAQLDALTAELAAQGRGCEWVPRGLRVVHGGKPWACGLPGAYAPGDVFEVEAGDVGVRVFVGPEGRWHEPPPGAWEVQPDGSLLAVAVEAPPGP